MAEETKSPTAKRWDEALGLAERDHRGFLRRGQEILRRYLDQDDLSLNGDDYSSQPRLNLLWSNVQTLKPAIYFRRPVPEISRRFKDKNPVGVWSSQVLQRAVAVALEGFDFNGVINSVIDDYLLPGRGIVWVRYEAAFATKIDIEVIEYERCLSDYVNWKDFRHSPARTWEEVTWVARRSYLSRDELIKRFDKKGRQVPLKAKSNGADPERDAISDRGVVWEIWDKISRKVYFFAPDAQDPILEEREPFIDFRDFFPCPRPLSATTANTSVIPMPDYKFWQDQGEEIDRLTQRIYHLTSALRLRGLYNAEILELADLLSEANTNQMIPIANWASFAGTGGVDGNISFVPLGEVVSNLRSCYEAREQLKNEVYEITGIADILRGAGDPGETATAVRTKGLFGSQRLRERQAEVARFVRDIVALMAEVIAEQYSVDSLARASGVQLPSQQDKELAKRGIAPPGIDSAILQRPSWEEIQALLRDDQLRSFIIDIETDSTLEPDQEQERTQRLEFLSTVTGLVRDSAPLIQAAPEAGPLLGRMITYALRSFQAGAQFEDEIETTFEAIQARVAQQQGGDSNQQQSQAIELQLEQAKIEAEVARAVAQKATAQAAQVRAATEVQTAQIEAESKAIEAQLNQQRLILEQQKLALEARELELRNRQVQLDFARLPLQAEEIARGGAAAGI